jgi:hypothetical protein
MLLFVAEPELGLPETDLAALRALAAQLPFEPAMMQVALLEMYVEPILADPAGHWQIAQQFYAGRPGLLARYRRVLTDHPGRIIFSTQALTLLMRLLIDHATDVPLRELTSAERIKLQDAVLGAHSAMETALDSLPMPSPESKLAYEVQGATFFHRPQPLEEMVRHRELLRLATVDERLESSPNRVPVGEWLAASGMNAEQQWAIGFGLAAATNALTDQDERRPLINDVGAMLNALDLTALPRELRPISASREEFHASFAAFGGGDESLAWELRPFKATPFLRLARDALLLLAPPFLLSWLGEGFHYRSLTYAQQSEGSATSAKYTRFAGEVVERYALDLAESVASPEIRVVGEQPYGEGGGERTSDVAIVRGSDLFLFEVHSRRVAATAAVTGGATAATEEISKLLVTKINQIGHCIAGLLSGEARLPEVDIDKIERVWPVVVSVGYVRQSENLWGYLRSAMDPTKTASLNEARVQPLQVLDIEDFEKLMAFLEDGDDLGALLARKCAGEFRERDLAVWFHQDPAAPSDERRLSILQTRWGVMGDEVADRARVAAMAKRGGGR